MATERLSMRKTREVLRQKWFLKKTHREVAASLGVSVGAITGVLQRALAAKVDGLEVEQLTDEALEARLYGPPSAATAGRIAPDPAYLHLERRKPGVTLQLLHVEYLEQHPDGYQYTQFCEIYRRWLKTRHLSMRQEHRAGEKLFVDYSGKKPHFVDPKSGDRVEVELFVAVLGASNYTYAEATRTQSSPDWIASHVRTLAFLGGAPGAIVPDQLKSGVTTSSRYEPGVQRTYAELARHYCTAVVPARPKHPRDKAKVEVGVLIAQRWILARLRHHTFFSLDELNQRIAQLVEDLNDRVMRTYRTSRRDLFERLERSALHGLPTEPFVYAEWKQARINIDYHVAIDNHYYSAPHSLVHEVVEARITATTVELFFSGRRIAGHARSYVRGTHTTVPEHMPKAHQKHLEWTPSRILDWAATMGPKTEALARVILESRPHPEQGYRSCLGILRLGKRYGRDRLEAACGRALAVGARSYSNVDSILKSGLDRAPLAQPSTTTETAPVVHENLRGRDYYN